MNKIEISFQEHQKIIYELLYALDDFCKENEIKYFLGFGTLLGAIRHHGIIPWDDDADVIMEREEYERFQKLIIANPPKGFHAYSIYNTKGYYYPYIKFGKNGTILIEPFDYVPTEGIGINIDVFPVDGCPGETREEAAEHTINLFSRYLSSLHTRFNPKWRELSTIKEKLYFLLHIGARLPYFQKIYFKKLYKEATRYSCKSSKYYSCLSWAFYGEREVHLCSLKAKTIRVSFGDRLLPVPIGYDTILHEEYGDYMTPPDDNGKKSTHVNKVYKIIP